MKLKLPIIIALVILVIAIILGISIWIYLDIKENERIDREAVTLKEDLTVEYGKEVKVSDFIANLNGSFVNDYTINTEKLGEIEVNFEYINIKNKKRKYTFKIETIDVTAPRIFSSGSYTVKVGYAKDLTEVIMSGDDIDDTPTREIIGEYDVNVIRRL